MQPLRRPSRSALDLSRADSYSGTGAGACGGGSAESAAAGSSLNARGREREGEREGERTPLGAEDSQGKAVDDIFYEGPADPKVLYKWDSGSPSSAWYATRLNKRRRTGHSRRCSLSLAPVDVLILLLSLGLLIFVQDKDLRRTCPAAWSDLSFLRKELLRCRANVRGVKKLLRGKRWQHMGQCTASAAELLSFLNFSQGQPCPGSGTPAANDLVETLLLHQHCPDLPRRTCLPRHPSDPVDPLPLPQALWAPPDNKNVAWEEYGGTACQSFECLDEVVNNGSAQLDVPKGHVCRDGSGEPCFRLKKTLSQPRPPLVWAPPSVSSVLAFKEPGTIRTGIDIWGATGNFAAEMAERGAVIVTTGTNQGLPILQAISLRGLPAMQLAFDARLPFFDSALDLVHCAHWPTGPPPSFLSEDLLELLLFEWDRVLRPGGLLWLDNLPPHRGLLLRLSDMARVLQMTRRRWKLSLKSQSQPAGGRGSSEEQTLSAGVRRYVVLEKPRHRHAPAPASLGS